MLASGATHRVRIGQVRWGLTLILALAPFFGGGCAEELETRYGQRIGPGVSKSVNGTAVLAEMFAAEGHSVRTATMLTPRLLRRADCIVWFPDDFRGPSPEVRNWFETWLSAAPGRTLIYVGRDYDAAPQYWQTIQPQAPPAQRTEVAARLSSAQSDYQSERSQFPADEDFGWFRLQDAKTARNVQRLAGDRRWTAGVDARKLEIPLRGKIVMPAAAERLLTSGGDMLVGRARVGGSQILVVTNGAFLLNLPLVNHEHRKLAGRLIEATGHTPQQVVFLESDSSGPPIRATDPPVHTPSGLDFLLTLPFIWPFLHIAALGLIFYCARWPIFGLPRELPPPATSDFGKHVAAVGKLLERAGDRQYAYQRLLHYRQSTSDSRYSVKPSTQRAKRDAR